MAPSTPVATIPALGRAEAAEHAAVENLRFVDLVRSLGPADWGKPTDCPAWDVRAIAGHVLGMWEFASSLREMVHAQRAGRRAARGRPAIDGITEVQVAERAGLTTAQLTRRLAVMAPRAARARHRMPAPVRVLRTRQQVGDKVEKWRLGYLFDVILTRDTWMHRIDISRATGHEFVLTSDHDGRLVADVVAEWARRHGRPFRLVLGGPAGGVFETGVDGEEINIDAIEFCRILSGRGAAFGLLRQPLPF